MHYTDQDPNPEFQINPNLNALKEPTPLIKICFILKLTNYQTKLLKEKEISNKDSMLLYNKKIVNYFKNYNNKGWNKK